MTDPHPDPFTHGDDPLATLRAELDALADESSRGCGQSYELYASRFSEAAAPLLETVAARLKDATMKIARDLGFHDLHEEPHFDPGFCLLTGIEDHCCPCGRHP